MDVPLASPPGAHPQRAARAAVAVTFFVNGALFGTWTPRIPAVKAELGLSDAQLGLALLGPAIGSVAALLVAGALAARYGSRRVTRLALGVFCLVPAVLGWTGSLVALTGVLALWGVSMGALDIAMNSAAMAVQNTYPRPIMSGFHAAFSGGALTGAALGSVAAAADVPVRGHLAVAAALGLVIGLTATRALLPAVADASPDGPSVARPTRALAVLGLIAFATLLSEGAAADWSAVYLREDLGATAGMAGLAYVAFSVTMTAGRLVGDRVLLRLGPVRVVRASAGTAALVLGAALVVGHPAVGVLGFAALGGGLACVVPVVFTAAARGAEAAGPALAAVSTCGYLGFIAGPPLIGLLGEHAGLPVALGVVVTLTAGVALLAGATAPAAGLPPAPVAVPEPAAS